VPIVNIPATNIPIPAYGTSAVVGALALGGVIPANAVLSSAIGSLAAGQESSAGCHSPTNKRDGRDKGRDNDCG
jgi:hypothetical protein